MEHLGLNAWNFNCVPLLCGSQRFLLLLLRCVLSYEASVFAYIHCVATCDLLEFTSENSVQCVRRQVAFFNKPLRLSNFSFLWNNNSNDAFLRNVILLRYLPFLPFYEV